MFAFLMFVIAAFLMLVIDVSREYLVRQQLQYIADSAASAGAYKAKVVTVGPTGVPRATITESQAISAAKQYIDDNKKSLSPMVKITNIGYNGLSLTQSDKNMLYNAGVFDVCIEAEVQGMFSTQKVKTWRHSTTMLNPKISGKTTTSYTTVKVVDGGKEIDIYDDDGNIISKVVLPEPSK